MAKVTQMKASDAISIQPTMSVEEQIRAILANASPEERAQALKAFQPPKRDIAKLIALREQAEAFMAKLFLDNGMGAVTGAEAFGQLWKAVWPKRYWRLEQYSDNGEIKRRRTGETWLPGGKGNKTPSWVDTGKEGDDYQIEEIKS